MLLGRGIQAAISQVEGDIIKVEENLVMLENKRDLNLLAVSWRRLTHRQRLDVLHSECLSEFNKTELLKVQDVPDTYKILSFKNGIGMILRLIPAGKFDMGASGSVYTKNAVRDRKVTISSSLWMGEISIAIKNLPFSQVGWRSVANSVVRCCCPYEVSC